ncbi:hypothetical protein FXN63_05430 [Pigmentiphaga aceris]|uniref:Cell envelope biogenesis protein TolA n=1 Tax=Pigmentiphaga aceris TaxID=1940612 RepID=A0A5C0AY92_9BURK|nr:hypothetical protein [Pigmentiphaga aceris]QEI05347.1 hypothetical protein FXN63_05430 [Pigmentiphaga aceris]
MNLKSGLAIAVLGLSITGGAFAATAAENAMKAQEERIEGEYKAQRVECDRLSGNQKDVCQTQAKANRDKALADNKAAGKTAEAQADAAKTKREADYRVAREKCDPLSGAAKDQCVDRAKADYGK